MKVLSKKGTGRGARKVAKRADAFRPPNVALFKLRVRSFRKITKTTEEREICRGSIRGRDVSTGHRRLLPLANRTSRTERKGKIAEEKEKKVGTANGRRERGTRSARVHGPHSALKKKESTESPDTWGISQLETRSGRGKHFQQTIQPTKERKTKTKMKVDVEEKGGERKNRKNTIR